MRVGDAAAVQRSDNDRAGRCAVVGVGLAFNAAHAEAAVTVRQRDIPSVGIHRILKIVEYAGEDDIVARALGQKAGNARHVHARFVRLRDGTAPRGDRQRARRIDVTQQDAVPIRQRDIQTVRMNRADEVIGVIIEADGCGIGSGTRREARLAIDADAARGGLRDGAAVRPNGQSVHAGIHFVQLDAVRGPQLDERGGRVHRPAELVPFIEQDDLSGGVQIRRIRNVHRCPVLLHDVAAQCRDGQ